MKMNIFKELNEFYSNRNPNNWNFAKHYIPAYFESNFIIHWVFGIIENFPFEDYTIQIETLDDMNARVKIEKDYNVLLKKDAKKLYKPISINQLAKKFNIPYSHQTTRLIPETPGTSFLNELSVSRLKKSLQRLSNNSQLNLFMYEPENYSHLFDSKKEYENINLKKYFEIQELYDFELDTCLFPNSFEWCLTTAEDTPMLLGCKKGSESEIRSKMDLEMFKIDAEQEMY